MTKIHMREELLHQIMDAAYISEHPELIPWAVNSCLGWARLCINTADLTLRVSITNLGHKPKATGATEVNNNQLTKQDCTLAVKKIWHINMEVTSCCNQWTNIVFAHIQLHPTVTQNYSHITMKFCNWTMMMWWWICLKTIQLPLLSLTVNTPNKSNQNKHGILVRTHNVYFPSVQTSSPANLVK
jgi:hypothetical protein